MDKSIIIMQFSNMKKKIDTCRSDVFRTPSAAERELGLWVDRIGSKAVDGRPGVTVFRIFGLYAAVFVESGTGRYVSTESSPKRVRQGDVIIVFPDIPHAYFPDSEWSTKWVVWGGPEAQALERTGFVSRAENIFQDVSGTVSKAFESLSGCMGREDIASIIERKKLLLGMIQELYLARTGAGTETNGTDARIRSAVRRLEAGLGSDASIKELAKSSGLSEVHFRRLFRKSTGRSPAEFIISMRISKAKEYLARGMPVKEVAERLGYRDQFYFMKSFRRHAGTTPARFRKSLDGDPFQT